MDSLMFLSGEESKLVMKNLSFCLVFLLCFLLTFKLHSAQARNTSLVTTDTTSFHIGVIVNLNSTTGMVANIAISMAVSDFYAVNRNSSYKLRLHVRDSKGDVTKAASAALDLIENVGVQAIIGPETSEEADFIASVGNKAQVPIISFSPIGLSDIGNRFPYFVHVAQRESSQVRALVGIVKAYHWKEVSIVHEDSQSGFAIVPYLTEALHEVGVLVPIRIVIPSNANVEEMNDKLHKLNDTNIRVFIVHLSLSIGTRFFLNVNQARMMQVGYAWLTTCMLTDQLSYMDPSAFHSMKGVVGLTTYVPPSRAHHKFRVRWKREVKIQGHKTQILEPNVYALLAYDTVYLIAMAADRASDNRLEINFQEDAPPDNRAKKPMDLFDTSVSPMGSELLQSLLAIQFTGLSGQVGFVGRQIQSPFVIVNVRKEFRTIGYWTPRGGLSKKLSSKVENESKLGDVIWPGGSVAVPYAKILRVGVPVKTGFFEFITVHRDSRGNPTHVNGFSTEIFETVMKKFGYLYHYEPYENQSRLPAGNYDNLSKQVHLKKYDLVVGDVTILADRSEYVAFTPPYTATGVQMIVPSKDDKFTQNLWWFLKPLDTKLWLTTLAFFLWKGILVWIFEHGTNPEFQGTFSQQLGKILYFSFSMFVYAHREKLESNYSRFIVNMWLFAVFVLVTSYTSQLTAMLAFGYPKPTITYLEYLQMNGHSVGYQDGSFVFGFLKSKKFNENQLKNLFTTEDYHRALSNGTVSAIVDEIPYVNVFLSNYCSQYSVTEEIYPSGGLGFVFPKYSPLLSDVSKEVLELMEGNKIQQIENKWRVSGACRTTNQDPLKANVTSNQLRLDSFRSIYIILAVTSILVLLAFFLPSVYKSFQSATLFGGDSLQNKFRDNEQPSEDEEQRENNDSLSQIDAERANIQNDQITLVDEEAQRQGISSTESA